MAKSVAVRLQDVLCREREAALNFDLSTLSKISATKEAMLKLLPTANLSTSEVSTLAEDVVRNQTIIASVIAGIESARHQIQMSKSDTNQVAVYNRNGTLEKFDNGIAQDIRKY